MNLGYLESYQYHHSVIGVGGLRVVQLQEYGYLYRQLRLEPARHWQIVRSGQQYQKQLR
jgi:hypothetical protein